MWQVKSISCMSLHIRQQQSPLTGCLRGSRTLTMSRWISQGWIKSNQSMYSQGMISPSIRENIIQRLLMTLKSSRIISLRHKTQRLNLSTISNFSLQKSSTLTPSKFSSKDKLSTQQNRIILYSKIKVHCISLHQKISSWLVTKRTLLRML